MSTVQIFKIVRAPEEKPLTAKELRGIVRDTRRKSEWEVWELETDIEGTAAAELDAAKKDTVRLDWMEQNNLNLIKNGYATMGLVCPITEIKKSVRDVIDAAMKELEEIGVENDT